MDLRSNCVQNASLGEAAKVDKPLKTLVGVAGFEPATPASRTRYTFSKPLILLASPSRSPRFVHA